MFNQLAPLVSLPINFNFGNPGGLGGNDEGWQQQLSNGALNFAMMAATMDTGYGEAQLGAGLVQDGTYVAGEIADTASSYERVVSSDELSATKETGLLRGGREGRNFFTNNASLDAKRAQMRLGLDGPLRDYRIRFNITNDAEVFGPQTAVPGATGTPGGGLEYYTDGPTAINIEQIDPLH